MTDFSFSVVINTYNRANLLANTIESLLRLRHPRFEIIAVNGPSTDETADVLAKYQLRIKTAQCAEANLSKSRNIGIAASAGDIVAFIDDDATAEPNWLCELEPAYSDPNVCAAGGFTRDQTGYGFQWKYMVCDWATMGHSYDTPEQAGLQGHLAPNGFLYPSGANSSFRRRALLEVGGFDEWYAYFADESDLVARLIDRGYSVRCLPAAQVHHRFAASHIRSPEHVPKTFLQVARSRGYFAARHSMQRLSMKEGMKSCNSWLASHLEYVSNLARDRKIDGETADRLTSELTGGMKEGLHEGLTNPTRRTRRREELDQAEQLKTVKTRAARERLRICFVTEELPPDPVGGIGVWTWAAARGLAAEGHEVSIVTRSRVHTHVDFEDGVWIHRLQQRSFPGRPGPAMPVVHPGLADHLLSVRDEILRIHAVRGLDVVSAPIWNVEGMALLATRELPMVLSLHTPMKAVLADRPDWQADPARMHWLSCLIAAERWCVERADFVVANSRTIVEEFERLYDTSLEPARLAIVPHGLLDLPLPARAALDMPEVTVLFVGRQEPRKGVDLLLGAIPLLLDRFPNVRFELVGEERAPPGKSQTYTKLFRMQHADAPWLERVDFRGVVSNEARDALYGGADIVAVPSRFESFGLTYIEAMRFAKPLVGCRSGAATEVIEDGVTGLLVSRESVGDLTEALAKLIMNPAMRRQMGRAGRRTFERRFDLRHMTTGLENAYGQVVDRARRSLRSG